MMCVRPLDEHITTDDTDTMATRWDRLWMEAMAGMVGMPELGEWIVEAYLTTFSFVYVQLCMRDSVYR